ncbi:MFS transporter [Massilia rhizosphaerae]|uniref:MFS transporter n=1 Tax=Massilia rhizosphaerae TaxID=2784389 RepID=UPI0018DC79B9|nr:MFS transporter [Massilia rhizosphaerae]
MNNVHTKPRLSLRQILEMNLGFFGLQFSFGLQQSNVSAIYSYLGASEASMPLLWLAGPITGLLVQPLIGAMSDRTHSRLGRRTPYFLVGAIICSLGLLAMPYSPTLWAAAALLWMLDAGNNVTMEPYRAYVSDRLDSRQHSIGFLTQSAFTGLAQMLSYLTPSIMVYFGMSQYAVDGNHIPVITRITFLIGAVLSLTTILWSILRVPELPLTKEQRAELDAKPMSLGASLREVWDAIVEMPRAMRQLALMKLLQWYGMACYWQFLTLMIGRTLFHTANPNSDGFRDAVLVNGQIGGFSNTVAFLGAFAMIPLTRRFGPKIMHAICLCAAGVAMLALPAITTKAMLFVPMVGVGLGWASIMGNPYVMLAGSIPPERTGVYMGIFNMFIVIPMLIQGVTLPFIYHGWLNGDPGHVVALAGVLLLGAAVATLFVGVPGKAPASNALLTGDKLS